MYKQKNSVTQCERCFFMGVYSVCARCFDKILLCTLQRLSRFELFGLLSELFCAVIHGFDLQFTG